MGDGVRTSVYAVPLLLLGLAFNVPIYALDPPHDITEIIDCLTCHITHELPDATIGTAAGNANLCLSCHLAGGTAAAIP